ncbi:hypothetical protein [Burkholderia singularis]|uniref:hypothetical protein n=1 Tax=Burkholderia singularis TaxID=1503053 RepID=UPI000F790991|nr:hypothetical protein [Burkholderia singularis]
MAGSTTATDKIYLEYGIKGEALCRENTGGGIQCAGIVNMSARSAFFVHNGVSHRPAHRRQTIGVAERFHWHECQIPASQPDERGIDQHSRVNISSISYHNQGAFALLGVCYASDMLLA